VRFATRSRATRRKKFWRSPLNPSKRRPALRRGSADDRIRAALSAFDQPLLAACWATGAHQPPGADISRARVPDPGGCPSAAAARQSCCIWTFTRPTRVGAISTTFKKHCSMHSGAAEHISTTARSCGWSRKNAPSCPAAKRLCGLRSSTNHVNRPAAPCQHLRLWRKQESPEGRQHHRRVSSLRRAACSRATGMVSILPSTVPRLRNLSRTQPKRARTIPADHPARPEGQAQMPDVRRTASFWERRNTVRCLPKQERTFRRRSD